MKDFKHINLNLGENSAGFACVMSIPANFQRSDGTVFLSLVKSQNVFGNLICRNLL